MLCTLDYLALNSPRVLHNDDDDDDGDRDDKIAQLEEKIIHA